MKDDALEYTCDCKQLSRTDYTLTQIKTANIFDLRIRVMEQ